MKLGYQAPKSYIQNNFNAINIKSDLHYCNSHNFVFSREEQERLLHEGKPCIYTDNRYQYEKGNFYKECYLFNQRFKSISLKACIRRTLKTKNIPKGTIVSFNTSWYHPKKKINTSYIFKVRKKNIFNPDYQVNRKEYTNNFNTCQKSNELATKLREAGFLVAVYNTNPGFIYGENDGEIALAFGYGKKIGFSSHKNNFRGYYDGQENILWDLREEFDKWSKSNQISKETPIDEILKILTN